jgi:hypothetical protein
METPYSRITEIREAPTPEMANDLLKQGFILVKVMEKYTNDTERQFSNIVYVLGKQASNGGYPTTTRQNGHQNGQPATTTTTHPAINPAILEGRPWKKYANGGGEWAFYMDRDKNLLPELASASEIIEKMKLGEELTFGNYTYKIKDKFLKRFSADSSES